MSERGAENDAASGWHFHPRLYPTQAWRDEACPDLRTAVPLPADDERVVRATTYPTQP